MTSLYIVLAIAIAVLLIILVGIGVNMIPPKVSAQASAEANGKIRFIIRKNYRINSLNTIAIWRGGSDDYLWVLKVGHTSGKPGVGSTPQVQFTYGSVPVGARQNYPSGDGPPAPIKPGDTLFIYVNYGFDYLMAACSGNHVFCFTVADSGEIRSVEPPPDAQFPMNERRR